MRSGVSHDGRRLVLQARDVPVIDSFQFFGPNQIPAFVKRGGITPPLGAR
jgi:hypothetical protein